jgi:hypothetical protein
MLRKVYVFNTDKTICVFNPCSVELVDKKPTFIGLSIRDLNSSSVIKQETFNNIKFCL